MQMYSSGAGRGEAMQVPQESETGLPCTPWQGGGLREEWPGRKLKTGWERAKGEREYITRI